MKTQYIVKATDKFPRMDVANTYTFTNRKIHGPLIRSSSNTGHQLELGMLLLRTASRTKEALLGKREVYPVLSGGHISKGPEHL